jgi:hypothetical protein
MDGKNATSTVRYLQDSILRGTPLGSNVVAAEGSEKVIDVVSNNPNLIGFVGLSWVGDSYDPSSRRIRKRYGPLWLNVLIVKKRTCLRGRRRHHWHTGNIHWHGPCIIYSKKILPARNGLS